MDEPKARFCGACGEPLARESRFCPSCGAPIDVAHPQRSPSEAAQSPDNGSPLKGVRSTPRPLGRGTVVVLACIAVVGLVAAGFLLSRPDEIPSDQLTADGIGPLRIGMSVDEALATGWVEEDVGEFAATRDRCGYATVTEDAAVDPEDLSVLFLDGELSLISASGDSVVVGPGNLRIGNHESDVMEAFGDRVEGQRTAYGTTQLDVIEDGRGMSFMLTGGDIQAGGPIVSSVKAGSTAGLILTEGCA